jgi:hypothetical protein
MGKLKFGFGLFYSTGNIAPIRRSARSPPSPLLLRLLTHLLVLVLTASQFLRVKESGHNLLIRFSVYLLSVKKA